MWLDAKEQKAFKATKAYQAITETKVEPPENDEHAR